MAKATVAHAKPVAPPISSVTLELTPFEAQVLRRITGSLICSAGAEFDAAAGVYRALKNAGVGDTPINVKWRDARYGQPGLFFLDSAGVDAHG